MLSLLLGQFTDPGERGVEFAPGQSTEVKEVLSLLPGQSTEVREVLNLLPGQSTEPGERGVEFAPRPVY